MSRILVTGALGTLGRPLVRALRLRNHEVHTLDQHHHSDPQHHRANIANHRELEAATRYPIDICFHLAAEFGRLNGEEHYESLWKSNVIGTRNILELQRVKEFKLVFASSSEVYGNLRFSPLQEHHVKANNPTYHNDYALTKRVNELQIQRFAHQHKTDSLILRFFNAYGPGEAYHPYRSVVTIFVHRLLHSLPITVYKNYHRVFMYIDDFIPTLANAAETDRWLPHPQKRVINIGGSEYRSVEELASICLQHTGADPSLLHLAGRELHNTVDKRPDITLAREILSHNPTVELEEGVRKTVDWHRSLLPDASAPTNAVL